LKIENVTLLHCKLLGDYPNELGNSLIARFGLVRVLLAKLFWPYYPCGMFS
jgi:hypothetical protein